MSLTPEESALVHGLVKKLKHHDRNNEDLEKYYEGKQRIKDFNISIPPQLRLIESVVGWAGTAVQVMEERLDFEGFIAPDTLGLQDVYRANDLDVESSLGHIDALVFGTGFIVVGTGKDGEANPLITMESPKRMTGLYDLRTRRLAAALSADRDDQGNPIMGTLYLPNETVTLIFDERGNATDINRDQHNRNRVPVVALPNNPRSSNPHGRSEITPAVRSYTDSAMRTLLGAEVAREFYGAPQRYILGADPEVFEDSDGNPTDAWKVYQGRVLGVPVNQDGQIPQVGQFQANDTRPYFDQLRAYAQMLSAETAIPASYLGFQTDNPASADAIRQMEARLIKRAERRQKQFGRGWVEVARLALLWRDGVIPEEAANIRAQWRDASTPTRSASADEAVKLISAGVLTPDSEITYRRIGLSDTEKQVLEAEKASSQATALVNSIIAANPAPQTPAGQ